jgi:hypothetical protein
MRSQVCKGLTTPASQSALQSALESMKPARDDTIIFMENLAECRLRDANNGSRIVTVAKEGGEIIIVTCLHLSNVLNVYCVTVKRATFFRPLFLEINNLQATP